MIRPPVESNSGLAAVLRGVVADFQHVSGADIVSIFLYEESTHTYYAPFATGQPQESLLDSLTDMHEQLGRYLADERQGKVPDELGVHQYGSTVWLTATRRRLVARNAPAEIDSTFIRRYQVQSTIGLPLLAGDRLLGLVYLNYRSKERAPDDNRLRELERKAATAAALVQTALEGAERAALDGLSRLTSLLTTPVGDARTDAKELRRLLSIALADLLMASNLDGAAIYQFGHQRSHLELVTAHLRVAAPTRVERDQPTTPWETAISKTVGAATAEADLHAVATYALGKPDEPHGYLVVLSRDRLATVRRAPATDEMLKAGAQLIGGALASQRLIAELENSNRLLSALGDMTAAMLKPGASRHDVIDAVVGHLTDSEVPEFDFNFATVYLLDQGDQDEATVVRMAAGAAWSCERGKHKDLIRIFVPFGSDATRRATGVLEVGYHRSDQRRPDWGQVEALRAAAGQLAVAVETARLYEEAQRHAEQLELVADVSKAIASSIDLDQTLTLVAQSLVRLVDASLCQIALYEEDREGWYGAAASDMQDLWRRQHGERSGASFLFDVMNREQPVVIDDTSANSQVDPAYVRTFGVRSLMALPLMADEQAIGAAILAERNRNRTFTPDEVQRAQSLAVQAAVAIKNARLHALAEEERHLQKDFVLIGFGQWGQKAYQHLLTLKQFFNFRTHVVEQDSPGARDRLGVKEEEVRTHGDTFYWDSHGSPAYDQLERELESSSYVITYIATPAATHLATLQRYYELSDVVLIEKPLGAPPDEYRKFLETAPGGVEIVAADHYYFKLEVRLLQLLLTEERTLRDFLESVEEIRIEILEEQPLTGAAADIGVIADLIPHAFAIISLLTPIDHIQLDAESPLMVGRHEGLQGQRESYARMNGSFPSHGRSVRLVIDVGKGAENAKWIKLSGERRAGGRSPSYKFDFGRGEAIDGTQATVRAAVRRIREPGVPDSAHLNMLRHVIDKRHPAVGILSIREAIRANQRVRDLEAMAVDLLARGQWTGYAVGTRPAFGANGQPSPAGDPNAPRARARA